MNTTKQTALAEMNRLANITIWHSEPADFDFGNMVNGLIDSSQVSGNVQIDNGYISTVQCTGESLAAIEEILDADDNVTEYRVRQ